MVAQRYDIVDIATDTCKGIYNFSLFCLKAFYRVSNLEDLKSSYDDYALSRFSQTVEVFQYEHVKIDKNRRKEFYEDLKYNEQNLAYLYSMFEKSRTSTFLIHMKILAKLSGTLIENKSLNYYESALLANISSLNELDFIALQKALEKNREIPITEKCIWRKDDGVSLYELIGIKKFINIGIINEDIALYPNNGGEMKSVNFIKNEYSDVILNILDEIAI